VHCRFVNGSYIELPCNEVTGPEQAAIAAAFDKEAQKWWDSVVAEPHSFTKQTFQLGLGGWNASNVEASGAFEISRGKVLITKPANFTQIGGRICIKINVSCADGSMIYTLRYICHVCASAELMLPSERPGLQSTAMCISCPN
jgi:hypothetical protein